MKLYVGAEPGITSSDPNDRRRMVIASMKQQLRFAKVYPSLIIATGQQHSAAAYAIKGERVSVSIGGLSRMLLELAEQEDQPKNPLQEVVSTVYRDALSHKNRYGGRSEPSALVIGSYDFALAASRGIDYDDDVAAGGLHEVPDGYYSRQHTTRLATLARLDLERGGEVWQETPIETVEV